MIVAFASCVFLVHAQETNKTDRFDPYPKAITGMGITDLTNAMQDIKGQIPVGPKIIGMTIEDESHIIVTTGKITGPLAGVGTKIFFEKVEGKWKKMKEIHWVS